MKEKNVKYTYYRLDFKNCNLDWDYTIVETFDEILQMIKMVDSELDTDDQEASVTVTGVGMTPEEFTQFLKSDE